MYCECVPAAPSRSLPLPRSAGGSSKCPRSDRSSSSSKQSHCAEFILSPFIANFAGAMSLMQRPASIKSPSTAFIFRQRSSSGRLPPARQPALAILEPVKDARCGRPACQILSGIPLCSHDYLLSSHDSQMSCLEITLAKWGRGALCASFSAASCQSYKAARGVMDVRSMSTSSVSIRAPHHGAD